MRLRDRLGLAVNYISVLKRVRNGIQSDSELARDPILRGAVERYLHLSIESLIDAGMRLCSLLKLRKPEKYRETARILEEASVLESEAAKKFELWIGLGNILVHGYAEIDHGKLYRALNEVEELEGIAKSIARYVEERGLDPEPSGMSLLVEAVRRILESEERVVFAYLFGSRARGLEREGSDVDVAVYTKGDVAWRYLVCLKHRLEDELKLEVDLVHLNKAPLNLAYGVVANGVPVLDREPDERIDYETKVVKGYLDLEPRLEEYYKHILS